MNEEGFTKLLPRIVRSTIWFEEDHMLRVWIAFLALVNKNGMVSGSATGMAHTARVTLDQFLEAELKFQSPDPHSTTKDNEGRRIKKVDGGWIILNFKAIRDELAEEERRHYQREWDRENRGKGAKTGECSPENNGKPDGYHPDSRAALHLLNEASGNRFREVDCNLKVISARLNEPGVDLAGVKTMILRQCKRWKGTEQADYLRPETIFGKTKFDGYYAAKDQPIHENDQRNSAKRFDRNKGTFNEGTAEQYDTERIQAARELREQQRRAAEDARSSDPVRSES